MSPVRSAPEGNAGLSRVSVALMAAKMSGGLVVMRAAAAVAIEVGGLVRKSHGGARMRAIPVVGRKWSA
jgi:hypothetical protein